MQINRSIIYRIYLTKKQKQNFDDLYFKSVFLFNKLLNEKKTRLENNRPDSILVKSFVSKFRELDHGNMINYLSTYRIVCNLIDKYHNNYINCFPNDKNFIKYPRKLHFDIEIVNAISIIKGNRINIPHIGSFKAKISQKIPDNARINKIIIEKRNSKEFFININIEFNKNSIKVEPSTAIGLDYSSPHFYIDSNNKNGDKYRVTNFNEDKIAKNKKAMTRCVYLSKNYLKLKEKNAKYYREVANKRRYYLNKAALELIMNNDVIGVETLTLAKMAGSFKLGKNTYTNAYDTFLKILESKAKEYNKYFIKIPKYYPSTRICSSCGLVHEKLSLNQRTFSCECGHKINRDLNAAINIREKALSMLKEKLNKKSYKNTL